jgi:hypothetical protein
MNSLALWGSIGFIFVCILAVGYLVDRLEGRPRTSVDLRAEIKSENLAKIHRNYYR